MTRLRNRAVIARSGAEWSDEAIQNYGSTTGLLRYARNDECEGLLYIYPERNVRSILLTIFVFQIYAG